MSAELLDLIEARGLLPMHDTQVLSATTVLAKEPVHGSWWAHPGATVMYRAITDAEDHEDVELVKLLGGKLTFVHRRLWLPLIAVATERGPWQTKDLPSSAGRLLDRVEEAGRVPSDDVRDQKKEVKLIEDRLLAFVSSVHTDSGRHEKVLESWEAWRKRVGLRGDRPTPEAGRAQLEEAAAAFAPLAPPWIPKRSRS